MNINSSYTWNPLGLVESFTNENGQAYKYKYSYKGLRNKKISNGETTSFYYLGDKLIGEEKGVSKTSYVRGNNILAKVIDGRYHYYFYNGHGDVVQITDEAGNVVNKYEYDEYGRIINKEEKIENAITYAGEYLDKESGNYYLKARYYNPQFRRFISKDSYEGNIKNPLSLNQYIYCNSNPLKYVDPSGNIPVETVFDVVSIGISLTSFVADPSLENAAFLAWDIAAAALPYVPGSYIAKGVKAVETADDIVDAASAVSKADNIVDVIEGVAEANPTKWLNPPIKPQDHHIIPAFRGNSKPYADFIKQRGINVDDFTITVSGGKGGQHMNFIHGKGEWNQKWMNFIDNNPNAIAKDIYQFAGKMMDEYKLSSYPIHPYGK